MVSSRTGIDGSPRRSLATTTTDGEDAAGLEFEPLELVAAWLDVQTIGALGVGLLGGHLANRSVSRLDADGRAFRGFTARGPESDHVWRPAPRLVYNVGRLRFAGEVEVTSAL